MPADSTRSEEDATSRADTHGDAALLGGEQVREAVKDLTDGAADAAPRAVAREAQATLDRVLEEVIPVEQPSLGTETSRTETLPEIDLPETVTGAYANELLNSHLELFSLGWSRSGDIALTDVQVYQMDNGLLALQACVDSSAVEIRNVAGHVVPEPTPRSLQIFLLEPHKEGYAVAAQTFPEDPSC